MRPHRPPHSVNPCYRGSLRDSPSIHSLQYGKFSLSDAGFSTRAFADSPVCGGRNLSGSHVFLQNLGQQSGFTSLRKSPQAPACRFSAPTHRQFFERLHLRARGNVRCSRRRGHCHSNRKDTRTQFRSSNPPEWLT